MREVNYQAPACNALPTAMISQSGVTQMKELHEPVGWVRVPLTARTTGGAAAVAADVAAGGAERPVLRAHFLQICVVSMHQNGRDTHIRQVSQPVMLYTQRRSSILLRFCGERLSCKTSFHSVQV